MIIQEAIQKQVWKLIDYLYRVKFFERGEEVLKRPSVLPSVGTHQKDNISQGGRVGGKIRKLLNRSKNTSPKFSSKGHDNHQTDIDNHILTL